MTKVPEKCIICQGGCCTADIQLFGLLQIDLVTLASYNLVTSFLPESFTDLKAMYAHLKETGAADGYYTLQNDEKGKDINGIRLGSCKALSDGKCLLQENKPHPCKMMDYEGPACMRIFTKRLTEKVAHQH